MDDTIFLTIGEVMRIHSFQVEQFGGSAAILDKSKLESAVAQPGQQFGGQYLHEDLAAMAAAYTFHIVQNHAFEDGNKRTGTHTALIFLAINGYEINLPTDEAEALILQVAQSRAGKPELTEFYRRLLIEQHPTA